MRTRILAWIVAVPLAVIGHAALAAPKIKVTRTVPYADLNLSHPEGAYALKQRVGRALRAVCGGPGPSLDERADQRRCMADAREQVRPQLDRVMAQAQRQPLPRALAAR